MDNIPISELDRIVIPDVKNDVIKLTISFLHHGTVQCSMEKYHEIADLLHLLRVDSADELTAVDLFENCIDLEPEVTLDDDLSLKVETCLDNSILSLCFEELQSTEFQDDVNSSQFDSTISAVEGGRSSFVTASAVDVKEELIDQIDSGVTEGLPCSQGNTADVMFSCSECDKSFTTSSFLEKHMNRHRRKKNQPQKCAMCSFESKDRAGLLQHQKEVHCADTQYECKFCKSKFASQFILNRHIAGVHQQKKFTCDLCISSFTRYDSLRRHKNAVHLKQKPYCCIRCGRCFARDAHLAKHICQADLTDSYSKDVAPSYYHN